MFLYIFASSNQEDQYKGNYCKWACCFIRGKKPRKQEDKRYAISLNLPTCRVNGVAKRLHVAGGIIPVGLF